MSRVLRKSMNTSYFHIMTQGINKNYIFDRSEDIKYYIKLMYKLLEEYNLKIISYCVMNNHVHILIKTKKINELSKYMQRLNCTYAKYYNKKYNKVGYVFRDRYKAEGIYNEKHYYNCIRYIYNNPVKAGICSKPEEYPYSNFKRIKDGIEEENYNFIDIEEEKEKTYKEVINQFLEKEKIEIKDLKSSKEKVKKLSNILSKKYKVSLRKIAKEININRETLRKLIR